MPTDEPAHDVDVSFVAGYHRVFVDGVEVSQHTTDRKAYQRAVNESARNPDASVEIRSDPTRVSTRIHIGSPALSGTVRSVSNGIELLVQDGTGVNPSGTTTRSITSGIRINVADGLGVSKAPNPTSRSITQGIPISVLDGTGVVANPAPPPTGVATHGKSLIALRAPFAGPAGVPEIAFMALANQVGRREGATEGAAHARRTFRTAGTISDLVVRITTNTSDAPETIEVYVNDAPSGLSVTVPAGTTGEFKNTSVSVAIAAGDTAYLRVDRSGATTGVANGPYCSVVFDAGSTKTVTPVMATGGPYNASATTEYLALAQVRDVGTYAEAQSQTRIDMDCTAQNAWLYVETNARTTSTTYTLAVNGTPSSIAITVPGGTTGYFEDTVNTAAITAGDLLGWHVLGGAETSLCETSQVGVELSASNPGESIVFKDHGPPNTELAAAATEYHTISGIYREPDDPTTESPALCEARFDFQVDRPSAYIGTNGITDTSTLKLGKVPPVGFGTDGPALTVGSGVTGWVTNTSAPAQTYETLDDIRWEFVGGATGTTLVPYRTQFRVTYTPSSTPPQPGGFDGPAELPRAVPSATPPDTTGYNVITVKAAGGDYTTLAGALADPLILTQNNVIEIDAGMSFTAAHLFPSGKTGNYWTVIRPSTHASLPAGTRVSPSDATNMYTLNCPLSGTTWQDAITFQAGASRYWVIGAEITIPDDATNRDRTSMVRISYESGGVGSNPSDYPSYAGIDRCYIHAPLNTASSGRRSILAGAIYLTATNYSIVNNYCEVATWQVDGQGGTLFWANHSPGPGVIDNNYANVTGNVLSGGNANPPILSQMADDVTFTRNHYHKDSVILDGTGGLNCLNQFEIKVGRRWLIEKNIFQGNESDAQQGMGILLRNVNQSNGSGTQNACEDITFRWNLIHDTPGCMDMAARGSQPSTPNPMKRVSVHDNLFVTIGADATKPAGTRDQFRMNNEAISWHIRHNTFSDPGTASGNLMTITTGGGPADDFLFKDNICWRGAFGMRTGGVGEGTVALDNWTSGATTPYDFDYNVIVGVADVGLTADYPAGSNAYPNSSGFAATNWRNPTTGDYRLIAGSTYASNGSNPASDGEDRGCDVQQLCGADYLNPATGSKLDGVRQAGT